MLHSKFQSALLYIINNKEKELSNVHVQELKNQWSAIKTCKIKRIFEKVVDRAEFGKEEPKVSFEGFCEIFPEFIRYEEVHLLLIEAQKLRIYHIFDRSNNGYVCWQDFFNSISIFYFADEKMLATLMFIIFDEHLEKKLSMSQLTLLIDLNAHYLLDSMNEGSEQNLEPEEIVDNLLVGKVYISLNEWLERSFEYFDFNQFRRLFNIFREEKLEKQLVQNFNEWNEIYDVEQGKYISYILSFKWFEAWKIYVENEYGISFNTEDKNPVTLKSIKTKKSLKTNNSNKSKRHFAEHHATIKKMKLESLPSQNTSNFENLRNKSINLLSECRNYDLIRSSIGERPKEIHNGFLEGEYAGTFKAGLVENRDYVFVSEKVWEFLEEIYGGETEFRRTGYDQIELYPKMVRIYNGMFKNEIEYSSEVYREVSNHTTIEDLMTRGLDISSDELKNISIFYRTFGMPLWEQISNNLDTLNDITPVSIILLVYLAKNSREERDFKNKYLSIPKTIKEANLGDTLIYEDNSNKIEKEVIFFSRTVEGKYIIHFIGESYINDLCLNEKEFMKRCKISTIPEQVVLGAHKNSRIDHRKRGIEDVKNLSFVVSMILQFLENSAFRESLLFLSNSSAVMKNGKSDENKTFLFIILSYINQLLRSNNRVDPRDIILLVEVFFPSFSNLDLTHINSFISQFSSKLREEAEILYLPNVIKDNYEFSLITKRICPKCGSIEEEIENDQYVLPVAIPDPIEAQFQVILVPFCMSLTSSSVKRYGFQLNKKATLVLLMVMEKEYKEKFMEITELSHTNFIFLEIESNTIIKNYNHIKDDSSTLEQLCLREDDNIFAFELCIDFSIFVKNHFSFTESDNVEIEQKDLKVGDMIDCRNPEKGWITGKILEKEIMPYTYQENLKVIHSFNNSRTIQNYEVARNNLALFPSKSHRNSENYHVKLIQRVFSEANNSMVPCNMPLVIVLTNWMRLKEFQYLVYMQIQRFISREYSFQSEEYTSNFIGSSTIEKSIMRETAKMKVKKFKEYLYGKNLPYKLNFMNGNGHCLICYKFVKSVINKGESEQFCQGCFLSNEEPICWQIMANDLVIAIDWKNPWCYKTNILRNHSSYLNMSGKRKKDVETIEGCLSRIFKESIEVTSMLCCNTPVESVVKHTIPKLPNTLIISLERIVEENGFKRKIKRPVYFGDEKIIIQDEEYKLMGLTVTKGHENNINYTTYLRESKENDRNRWLAYNGERVEIVKKEEINKRCTLVLFYEKAKINQKVEKIHFNFGNRENSESDDSAGESIMSSGRKKNDNELKGEKEIIEISESNNEFGYIEIDE